MTLLAEVLAYLVSGSVCSSGTAAANGWSGYIGKQPAAPDRVVTLFEYGGFPPELTHDKSMDVMPSFQVRVRCEAGGYATGIAKADAVLARLHGVSNSTLTTTSYKLIRGMSSPAYLGTDDKGRPEWTVNFQTIKAP